MNRTFTLALIAVIVFSLIVLIIAGTDNAISSQSVGWILRSEIPDLSLKSGKTLESFRTQEELDSFLTNLAEKQKENRSRQYADGSSNSNVAGVATDNFELKPSAGPFPMEESVTNVQHAGVDEGGIVKLHGDHLVILRRGRLFTVKIGDNSLRPVSAVDAFGPGMDPQGTWYDEMLISSDTVFVIGYSYERGGTEVVSFRIEGTGKLSYLSTYHIRSNDYFSSRNYASRLVDGKLVFYMPQYLWFHGDRPEIRFPAYRRWRKGVTDREFVTMSKPQRVYKPARRLDEVWGAAIHTVAVCEAERGDLDCRATSVLGPAGRVFYVSPESVYIWTTSTGYVQRQADIPSMLYKLPLDGSAPQALGVSGSPIDQFSFQESPDGYLNVLVRDTGAGDGMWNAEQSGGRASLLRVRTDRFCDGSDSALESEYTEVPRPEGHTVRNRFVGDFLLYGRGSGWGYPESTSRGSALTAVRFETGEVFELDLPHGVDRIEALGKDAIAIGSGGKDLHFSPVDLAGRPSIGRSYVRENASQGELRSHGFFYKPESRDGGVLGLPIREAGRPGYEHLFRGSASILFLRSDSLKLSEMGALRSDAERTRDDNCKASCVDWYGNARPLFIRGRIIALLGYELVEGERRGEEIRERRRTNFSPANRTAE
ncbi:MAG TPA: beta-propeller domain-containing protein [Aridibacter sp.]|nr:beta-propeller domain-containing protein [Aridibacter sp.]